MIHVKDIRATIAFWCDKLGFSCTDTMEEGGVPPWCNLVRDHSRIMFTAGGGWESSMNFGCLYFHPGNVDALYAELLAKGGSDGVHLCAICYMSTADPWEGGNNLPQVLPRISLKWIHFSP